MFNITDFVEFGPDGRAQCPACVLAGKKAKNLSLLDSGAYKCHRGCTTNEIRAALGQEKATDHIAPPPAKKIKPITEDQVMKAHEQLMNGTSGLDWLQKRGFTPEMIAYYKLGAVRAKCGEGYLPAIAIPLPVPGGYQQKKRVAPWLPTAHQPKGYKAWSQYGIDLTAWVTHQPENPCITWLCEGEWDAMRLGWLVKKSELKHEVQVCCFTGGAGNAPPTLEGLADEVITFYDLDEPGIAGATKLQNKHRDRVKVARVPSPEAPDVGWDVSDAITHGFTVQQFFEAAVTAEGWQPEQAPNPLKARLITNDELIARAPDSVEWLVPDLLTQDELFILAMPPRGGKSLFGLTLAKAVATGGKFLDRPVTKGSVLYVNLEDSEAKIKLRQASQDWGANLPVFWLDKFKLSELDHLRGLANDIPDLRLIILDTFSRIRDDGTKESSAELGKTLEPLQEFCKELGVTVLMTHHTGKLGDGTDKEGSGKDPFDMMRGSTSIRATCRGAIVIIPGDNCYRLLAENGFSDQADLRVRINPQTLEWNLLGNWQPRVDADMKGQVLDHLNLIGSATASEIAAALNFNASSVSTCLYRLQADGQVDKIGGKGRTPATYTRSANLRQQLEVVLAQPNSSGESDIALRQQEKITTISNEKVCSEPKSMQSPDPHLSPLHTFSPTHTNVLAQGYNPDSVSVSERQQPEPVLAQAGAVVPGQKVALYQNGKWLKGATVKRVEDKSFMSQRTGKLDQRVAITWRGTSLNVALADLKAEEA